MVLMIYSAEELLKDAIDKGAYACIHKPMDMDAVLAMVEEITNKSD